jgi:hypothetical protein
VRLDETFKAGPTAKSRPAQGRPGFPTGSRVHGTGSGKCYAESPATTTTGPDGSAQFLGSAARLEPGSFRTMRIATASSSRGLSITWVEPVTPSLRCNYFGEAGTELALPPGQALPGALVATIGPRALKRARYGTTIAGSQDWTSTAADGTQITGRASWKLRLDFRR